MGNPTADAAPLAVLVVDDSELTLAFIEDLLAQGPFEVATASSVETARSALKQRSFDLVLLDKVLPDGDGLELARDLTSGPMDCEVVLMSAYADLRSAVDAVSADLADFLVKPLDPDDLLTRLERVANVHRLKLANKALLQELREKNEELARLAVHDPLTKLYNHAHLQESLARELARSRRHGQEFSLVLIDFDGFKAINDSLGHQAGDGVLRAFGELLAVGGRRSDLAFRVQEREVAARYGGDEFALVLPNTSKAGAAIKAEKLRALVEERGLGSGGLRVTLSIGVASFPADADDRAGLIRAADTAMYAAKRAGRNQVIAYSERLERGPQQPADGSMPGIEPLELTRKAIASRAFYLCYQPIVALEPWRVAAWEAVPRPDDPRLVSAPSDFFALAEQAALGTELARVLRWLAVASLEQPAVERLFVKLHGLELNDPELIDPAAPIASFADRLVFELVDAAAVVGNQRSLGAVAALREAGFGVALGSIGRGYAGIDTLLELGADYLRVGIEDLRRAERCDRRGCLARHLLEVARGEGAEVMALGIESADDLELLRRLEVSLGSGPFAPLSRDFQELGPRPGD